MLGVFGGGDEEGRVVVVYPEHQAAIERRRWAPRFERDVWNEVERDGPERFWDDFQMGGWWEMAVAFVDREPAATGAVGMDEFGRGELGGIDVIEEATIDELLHANGLLAVGLWEGVAVFFGEGELMAAQALEFSEIIVAGVGAGEGEAGGCFDGEVEFGGEF